MSTSALVSVVCLFMQARLKLFLALMPADDNEAAQVAANGNYF